MWTLPLLAGEYPLSAAIFSNKGYFHIFKKSPYFWYHNFLLCLLQILKYTSFWRKISHLNWSPKKVHMYHGAKYRWKRNCDVIQLNSVSTELCSRKLSYVTGFYKIWCILGKSSQNQPYWITGGTSTSKTKHFLLIWKAKVFYSKTYKTLFLNESPCWQW
jgi:hypothetical protein